MNGERNGLRGGVFTDAVAAGSDGFCVAATV